MATYIDIDISKIIDFHSEADRFITHIIYIDISKIIVFHSEADRFSLRTKDFFLKFF